MGRPKVNISQRDFEQLCGLQCTMLEICDFFDVSDKTLQAWCKRTYKAHFSEVFKRKRGKGKISLRRAQFRLAEKSAPMAIFLGKVYLGQREDESKDEEILAKLDEVLGSVKDGANRAVRKAK